MQANNPKNSFYIFPFPIFYQVLSPLLSIGNNVSGKYRNTVIGECSLVIGNWNEGHTSGISIGTSNTGDLHSVIVGNDNKVGWKSMAIGNGLMLDKWSNGIAIGKYNKTSAACFVVGNGDADDDRRDLVVIDDNGIVSATNIVTPGGISLVDFYNAFTAYTANHQ